MLADIPGRGDACALPTAEDTENPAILTADGTSPTHAIRHALGIAARMEINVALRAVLDLE